jgi:hypothetical protein
MINKSSLLKEILEFKDMFPEAYKPDAYYQDGINQMKKYVVEIYEHVDNFETTLITMRDNKVFTFVASSDVQKLIKR